jgi:xylose isomerase
VAKKNSSLGSVAGKRMADHVRFAAAEVVVTRTDYLKMREARYSSFDTGAGAEFEKGMLTFEVLHDIAVREGEPKRVSGKQELYEAILNQRIERVTKGPHVFDYLSMMSYFPPYTALSKTDGVDSDPAI